MIDFSHLEAIILRLENERRRLDAATKPAEIATRKAWVAGCEKEIANEYEFLGIDKAAFDLRADELLAELAA
jgi:hypothetical protein